MKSEKQRIREHAERLWREAGAPPGRQGEFVDRACELVAIEDEQRHATRPLRPHPEKRRPYGEPVEPLEAVENEGEFPVLTDQGEKQTHPGRRPADGGEDAITRRRAPGARRS